MEHLRKLRLLDDDGKPLNARVEGVLSRLVPKFRKRFPTIQDEVEITEAFEEAARRIARREERSGPIDSLHGYAWVALRSVGVSRMRRSAMRVDRQTIEPRDGHDILSGVATSIGSPDEIERDVFLQEIMAQLTPDERTVIMCKKAGFTSEEIARRRECTVNAVDVLFTRLKKKIRRLIGVQE